MRVSAPLDDARLARGVRALCAADRDLAAVVERSGPPPLWSRQPGFATLVQIILEQQVSLASGRAAYGRMLAATGAMSPEAVAAVDDARFATMGLTRQKSSYVRALARAIVAGELDLARLASLDDESAHGELVRLRGIGPWTADIYLLMALGRPDVWPRHDLALVAAAREVKRLRSLPDATRMLRIAERWRPWRAVAARILWHHYLSTPRRRDPRSVRDTLTRQRSRRSHAVTTV